MKKLIVFIFSIVLLGSCDKEEWHEHRVVNFGFNEDISYNQNDGELTRFDFRIEYKIIGDPNADTSSVNLLDVTYEESQWSSQNHSKWVNFDNLSYYEFMNYDHLEFKVTTSCNTVKPIDLELNFIAQTYFANYTPSGVSWETLLTVNSSDTTIYFTWSPPNFN